MLPPFRFYRKIQRDAPLTSRLNTDAGDVHRKVGRASARELLGMIDSAF